MRKWILKEYSRKFSAIAGWNESLLELSGEEFNIRLLNMVISFSLALFMWVEWCELGRLCVCVRTVEAEKKVMASHAFGGNDYNPGSRKFRWRGEIRRSYREQRDQCFADPSDVKVILESEIT